MSIEFSQFEEIKGLKEVVQLSSDGEVNAYIANGWVAVANWTSCVPITGDNFECTNYFRLGWFKAGDPWKPQAKGQDKPPF